MFLKSQFYPGSFAMWYAEKASEKAQGVEYCYLAVPAGIYKESIGKDYAIK